MAALRRTSFFSAKSLLVAIASSLAVIACSNSDMPGQDIAPSGSAGLQGSAGLDAMGGAGATAVGGSGAFAGTRGAAGANPAGSNAQSGMAGRRSTGNGAAGAAPSGRNAGGAGGGPRAGSAGSDGTRAGTSGAPGAGSGGSSSSAGSAAVSGSSGSAAVGGRGGMGPSGASCPYTGHVSYTLAKSQNPTATEQAAYDKIKEGMDKALSYYNCYTNITKTIQASYVPSVQTADGNINGSLRFGSNTTYMDYRTCMHEISHTVGIGQASNWSSFLSNGLFTGAHAKEQLQTINSMLAMPGDGVLHADTQHFWPYGINQQSEVKSEADLIAHCQMVVAFRLDLGLN